MNNKKVIAIKIETPPKEKPIMAASSNSISSEVPKIQTISNIVFIGDSWMDNYYFKQEFQKNNNTIIAKCGAWAMHYVKQQISIPIVSNAKLVYIQLGLNDWQTGQIGLTNQSYMKRFLDDIAIKYPNVTILVGRSAHTGAGYPTMSGYNINPNCDRYSNYVKQYCDTHCNFKYIDTTSILEDSNGWLKSDYADSSTYHLSAYGNQIWFNQINTILLNELNNI